MSRAPIWRRYLRFFGPDVRADVNDELHFHLEAKTRELIDQGRTPEEAQREARRLFGNVEEVSTMCREIGEEQMRKIKMIDRWADWWYDFRHALRSFRRQPKFAVVVVATLAAGIAGATSLFSVVDSWVIRAVRFPKPQQLVFARSFDPSRGRELEVSMADYEDLRQRTHQFQNLAAVSFASFTLNLSDGAERIAGANVSPNFFATLATEPALGRAFIEEESKRGHHQVAIVSYGFWKTRLNGAVAAVGSTLNLDGEPYTIVGVLPERFHFTLVGRANIWTPLAPTPEELFNRKNRTLQLIGRMKTGTTVAQARQELNSIAGQLEEAYPDTNHDVRAFCISLSDEVGRHTGEQVVLIVFAVTLGLLLMACANVANLLLVRSLNRKRQSAIQLSLGASRGRLVRQALVETLTLFLCAAVLGTLGGGWLTNFVSNAIPFENRGYLPDYGQASVNGVVLLFVLGVTLLTALIFGLGPAFEGASTNVVTTLKESGSAVSHSTKAKRLRVAFVTAQILLATILLSSTAMLVQGMRVMWSKPLGFDSSGMVTFKLSPNDRQYRDATRRRILFEDIATAIQSAPQGVKPAIANFVPFANESGATAYRLQDQPYPPGRRPPTAEFIAVSPEYFSTLHIRLLAGRAFESRDNATGPLVAIVNDAFVAQNLQGKNPLGQMVWLGRLKNRPAQIVGVAPEVRQNADPQMGLPQIYASFAQTPVSDAYFILRLRESRVNADPLQVLPDIRRRIAAIDSQEPIFDAKTMDDRLNEVFAPYRIISGMLLWFGALALILAAVGVYAVVAFSVSQRTREIGIRAALGAERSTLLAMFLRQGLLILAAGLTPGILAGIATGIALRSVLLHMMQVNVTQPLIFAGVTVGITVLAATLAPARRAAAVDPLSAIRYE